MALSRVEGDDEIYVSGIFTLKRQSTLKKAGITHILSALVYDFREFENWDKFQHLQIPALDVDDENLLGEFERTGSWIENALEGGGRVLIHCAMGKSRSVTVTIAFLLRKYPALTVKSALELIRKSRPMAEPNDGFMDQLKLYKEMGCPKDIEAQPRYQRWLYKREVDEALACNMAPDRVRFEDEEKQEESRIKEAAEEGEKELRCKRCRKTLANSPYLVSHDPSATSTSACTHHFLHPLSWMRPTLSESLLSGRLECPNPKCEAQVGRYAWQGMRCSCGIWVCPAFSLQKGRVDEVIMKPAVEVEGGKAGNDENDVAEKMKGLGIRLPPGMRGADNGTKGNL